MFDQVKDHGLNFRVKLSLAVNAEIIAAPLEQQIHHEQSGAFVTVDKAMIARQRLDKRCGLPSNGPIIPRIWSRYGSFNGSKVANSLKTTKCQRKIMGNNHLFEMYPVVASISWQDSSTQAQMSKM
jgi:hypothetical protein